MESFPDILEVVKGPVTLAALVVLCGFFVAKECARNNFLKQPSLNNEISPLN
ncbi:hypothetical protein [Bathymodiolus platifrons methanotrophic gill symbiont]|uniref:hypothetical protein n=1 Tax=Bathymodiolus platifrons methanotrophic gill symbiont TaxID=113268 RepID=UPI001C8D44F1|nr:hypothetical protein [Bathymodiolus platifrons methanotrophic gill symbiont]